jgi:tetratricopeptide (TPR) repeat protein
VGVPSFLLRIAKRLTLIAALGWTARDIYAQRPPRPQTSPLARADSAWNAGDRVLARQLYTEVVAANPDQSHAIFRLAQLESAPSKTLQLYERYAKLEPKDAWGQMAVGDALARLHRYGEALDAYDHAQQLAPGERDVVVGRARILSRAGQTEASAETLAMWVAQHDGDAEAWELLGRERLRMGRPGGAATAFQRAQSLGRTSGAVERIAGARAQASPAVEPTVGYLTDSDGNHAMRLGGLSEIVAQDGLRVSIGGHYTAVGDATQTINEGDGIVRLSARPRSTVQLQLQGGASRVGGTTTAASWTAGVGEARLRLRAPLSGPSLDLRAQRVVLDASPLLLMNQAVRSEARATLELPVGALRLRGTGRAGTITAVIPPPLSRPSFGLRTFESNSRFGGDLAVALPLGSRAEFSVQDHRLAYASATMAGYFAPRLVETREAGMYFELGEDGITLATDLGAGVQRAAEHGAPNGHWTRALRGWSYLNIPFAPGRALWVEAEGYDAPFAPEGVATSASWRSISISTGLRWAIR